MSPKAWCSGLLVHTRFLQSPSWNWINAEVGSSKRIIFGLVAGPATEPAVADHQKVDSWIVQRPWLHPRWIAFQRRDQLLRQDSLVLDTINHQAMGHIIINGHWERMGCWKTIRFPYTNSTIGPWSVDIMSIVEDGSVVVTSWLKVAMRLMARVDFPDPEGPIKAMSFG